MMSDKDAPIAVQKADVETEEAALREMHGVLQEQKLRLQRFRDSSYMRRFSESGTRQRVSLVAGMMNCSLRTERRWNQELQYLIENGARDTAERRSAINALLQEFSVAARRVAKQFILRSHFDESDAQVVDRPPSALQSRASSRVDSRPSSRADLYAGRRSSQPAAPNRNSPTPIGDTTIDNDVTTPVDDGPWASSQEEAAGLALRLSLLDNATVAKRATKESQLQYQLLGQMLDAFPSGRLPITVFPTCICTYAGHSVRVSSLPGRNGASIGCDESPELALALEYAGDALNIAKYDYARDDGSIGERVGPPEAAVFEGGDGRLYVETVLGFYPHFPPARGSPITNEHTLFLRPELVASSPASVSPGAFVTYGGNIGPQLREQTLRCAERLCGEVIPRLGKELASNPPADAQTLISERMKPRGVNIAMLGVLLHHIPTPREDARAMVLTEMFARAARRKVEDEPADNSDAVQDTFKEMCASVCNPDTQAEALEALLPEVYRRFPGSSTLVSGALRAPGKLFKANVFALRLAELHGMVLARGVDGTGTAPFHFTVERMRVRVSSVRVDSGFSHLALEPTSPAGVGEVGIDTASLNGTRLSAGLEAQIQRAVLLRRALNAARQPEALEICRALGEMAHHRSLRSGKQSFAYRFELYSVGCHVAHVLPERALHYLTQALDSDGSTWTSNSHSSSPTMVRCLCERARLLTDMRRFDEAQRDLDDATAMLPVPRAEHRQSHKFAAFDEESLSAAGTQASFGGLRSSRAEVSPRGAPTVNVVSVPMFNELARLNEAKGDFAGAEEALGHVLHIQRTLHGDAHLATATAYGALGYNLFQQGEDRYEDAIAAFKEDIRICQAVAGERSRHLAASAGNLAILLTRMGRHEEAAQLHQLDVEVTSADPTASADDVATSKTGLGICLTNVGRLEESQSVLEDALRTRLAHHGRNDPSVAVAFANLARTLILRYRRDSVGDHLDEARGHCIESVRIIEEVLGTSHRLLRLPLEHLAVALQLSGEPAALDAVKQRLQELADGITDVPPLSLP